MASRSRSSQRGAGFLGKRLDKLLGRPRRRGMLRDPKMDDTPTVMGQEHEHEQHASGDRRYGKEVQRYPRCPQQISATDRSTTTSAVNMSYPVRNRPLHQPT